MTQSFTTLTDDALIAIETLASRVTNLVNPTVRLGVTGLSRSGKTVFITALVNQLLAGSRLPMLKAQAAGRLGRAQLDPQPDDNVPRFDYERHLADLLDQRVWPASTRSISELRLTIHFRSASAWNRMLSPGKLTLDIVDYPGEWLMDLPLLGQDYRAFSDIASKLAADGTRGHLSAEWRSLAGKADPLAPADEVLARDLAAAFTAYLKAAKADEHSFSALAPGRFLMPGDLDGSPALTFSPLPGLTDTVFPRGSLGAMMERRFESYKSIVVRPFFREHFARLDRQIVLVDALSAINRGPEAVRDLETALGHLLSCFRTGSNPLVASLITRRIDKVLVAATKADHLHHESHDRLERATARLTRRAIEQAGLSGASVEVMALASVRTTTEGFVERGRDRLPVVIGTPLAGERIGGELFDGNRKTAVFPGDLPDNPDLILADDAHLPPLSIVRFRPPAIERKGALDIALPHVRLDRALEFLIGDHLA